MINDYSWVAEKKQEAMRQKLQQRGMPRYAQRPVSERFGVSYTGLGSDGRLDRTAPAGFDTYPTPHVYHEGETRIATPEGRVYLDADVTQGAGLSGEAAGGQAPSGQMPGFASGGGMTAATGYTGAHGAPQYAPTPAPRVAGNPYLANTVPGHQQTGQPANPGTQQYPPRVQGWNVNPIAMGNYGAALLAQDNREIPPQPQQPSPAPIQQPQPQNNQAEGAAQPMMWRDRLQGFASGGGLFPTPPRTPKMFPAPQWDTKKQISVGNGGQDPVSGTNTVSAVGTSGGAINTSGTAGTVGSGTSGGATDTLKNNGGNAAISKPTNSPFNAITSGILKAGEWLNNGGVQNAVNDGTQWLLNNGVGKTGAAERERQEAERERQEAERERQAAENAETERQARIAAANTPPEGLSTEKPVQPTYSNEPTSISFQRGAEGQWRMNDMQREAAAQQSYQDFQQAMRGTDANAAWAQDQMLRAQQEEGINNFAAQYAQGADERNWNRINDMMGKILADPNSSAADLANAAQMANQLYPGADIDFSGRITEANARQFNDGMAEVLASVASGYNWEEAWPMFKASGLAGKMGLSEAELWSLYNGANVNIIDKQLEIFFNSEEFKRLPPEQQNAARDYLTRQFLFGEAVFDSESGEYRLKSDIEAEEAKEAEEFEAKKESLKNENPWTSDAVFDILRNPDSNEQAFREIIEKLSDDLKTGAKSTQNLLTLPADVRMTILKQFEANGMVVTEMSPARLAGKRQTISGWGYAGSKGDPIVKYGGRYARIVKKEDGGPNPDGITKKANTVYTIQYLDGEGEQKTVWASSVFGAHD